MEFTQRAPCQFLEFTQSPVHPHPTPRRSQTGDCHYTHYPPHIITYVYVCTPARLNRYQRISDAGGLLCDRTGLVGVRDYPYGICCPWVLGEWGLDALGKFFRRRRGPLLFRQILEKVVFLIIFHQKQIFWDICFKVVFFPKNFRRRHASPLGEVE